MFGAKKDNFSTETDFVKKIVCMVLVQNRREKKIYHSRTNLSTNHTFLAQKQQH